ncbi:alpha/beta fold hydrolase [Methylobacterium haplocladii]|uniref:Alpha/beta hydrolase n=1 Tax=Methylobacterium haplocladii TaxID=1176176 RepID=A0A512IJ63_9HYPH|nr:alpha/beta hydrolase [Methylobacterium haplocladii]GEO97712.1 alpha/beta hydrolase [Methylobacterium haplocladii]GJD84028.1 Haloalkane dehalogenase [Methylobacterium haplocladii]GLS57442.1 alpha/beta hydrolase [Methylobacterium haplocladii]
MFPFGTRRSAKRAVRRGAAQLTKLLTATAKPPRTAVRTKPKVGAPKTGSAVRARKTEASRKAPGRFVEIDQLRVHCIVRGRGRPVVLLHGNGTMAEDFVICGLIERLATRYRVIAIDRPGFGHTARPRARVWTAVEQAQLMHRVLAALKVERPLVVGHSWGTLVALALAAGGLRELRGLVLLSGYYYPSRRADVTMSKTLAMPGIGDAARAMMNPAMGRLVAAQAFRQVFRPQAVPPRFEAEFPVEIAMGPTQMRASTEDASTMNTAASGLQHTYPRLDLPVAILTGDADAVVDIDEQSRRLHGEIAGSTLKILPGLGHMIHYAALGPIDRAIDGLMAPGGRSQKAPRVASRVGAVLGRP